MDRKLFQLMLWQELYAIAHDDKVEAVVYEDDDPSGLYTRYFVDLEGLQRLLYEKLVSCGLTCEGIAELRKEGKPCY